ncbi:hypothetical protein EON82_21495 [bacterium]|nr:MAG: hypothetical protein EON82_21495 [bacterium]
MSVSRIVFVLVPLALSATGSAQSVLLRLKPPVGAKRSYISKMTMTMSSSAPMPGMNGPMVITTTTPMEIRVVKRVGNVTTMETKTGKPTVTLPKNSPMAGMKSQMEKQGGGVVGTVSINEFGEVKGFDAKGSGQNAAMAQQMSGGVLSGLQGVSLPKRAVKVGDTWSSSIDMGKAVGMGMGAPGASQKMPVTFRLASIENKGGKRLARVAMTMKGSMKVNAGGQQVPITMNMSGHSLFEIATGLTVGTSMTSDSTFAVMGNTMKQHMVMSMTAR